MEAPASAEGDDHDVNLTKRNDKKHERPATKSTAEQEEEAQPAGAGKKKTKEKRKRVVRDRLSEKFIGIVMVHSSPVFEIPDERLLARARCSEEDRARYAERKALSEKWIAEEQDLIDQYLINGYAESVWEVTDDEDDGDSNDTTEEIVDIIN